MRLDGAQVVIIGAGVTGLSAALWLAKNGVDTIVVEKGVIGAEASSRNGGDISHRAYEPPVVPLAAESLKLWPEMSDELGYPTEYSPGGLHVAMDEEEAEWMKQSNVDWGKKFDIPLHWWDADEVKDAVPLIAPETPGAQFSPTDGHANPQRTVQAYAWGFLDNGGRLYQHTAVTGFRKEGEKVVAVETDKGEVEADIVVCAAGPQTGVLCEQAGAFVPVAPARVEIIITAPVESMWKGAVLGNGLYGRQTLRGNLAYGGGPHEWVDVENQTPVKPNSPVVRNMARRLAELFPGASDVPLIRSWACVVEQTPDMLPIIDFLDSPDNFMVATASAHGFGLSPATGKVISDMVMHGETTVDMSGLTYGRFNDVTPDWREKKDWVPGHINT